MSVRHTHARLGSWPSTRPGRLVLLAGAGALLFATAACNSREPNVSPDNPSYSQTGAPRAGQPSGTNDAGAPSASGNYAPLEHQDRR